MNTSAERIDEIFWEALKLTALDERQAYLERACGGDAELRQLLDKLLPSDQDTPGQDEDVTRSS